MEQRREPLIDGDATQRFRLVLAASAGLLLLLLAAAAPRTRLRCR